MSSSEFLPARTLELQGEEEVSYVYEGLGAIDIIMINDSSLGSVDMCSNILTEYGLRQFLRLTNTKTH
ncbi:MAG: hypothetical protein ACP5KB_01040 [Thermoprotei archaeon]